MDNQTNTELKMRTSRYILTLFAIMPLASCIKDGYDGRATTQAGELAVRENTIVFSLTGSVRTRAVDDIVADEGTINRLDVFFYDEYGTECLFHPEQSRIAIDDPNVTITIPGDIYNERLLENDCTVYVLANCNLDRAGFAGLTLDQIKDLDMENGAGRVFNTGAAPEDFLMTGQVAVTMTRDKSQNLGKIVLRRAAAKVVVDISNAAVTGYTPAEARVRISNYLDNTKIDGDGRYEAAAGSADYKTATKTLTANGGQTVSYTMDPENALYTYSNDWRTDMGRETYITLEVDWVNNETLSRQTYYYRVPFSYINAQGNAEDHRARVRRNFVYHFTVNVAQLGGLDPEDAVDLDANFDVLDWNTRDVAVSILSFHYLFVNTPVARTKDPWYEWEYRSSLDVEAHPDTQITRAWSIVYTAASGTGTEPAGRRVDYLATPNLQPRPLGLSFREAAGKTYMRVDAWAPINYVPLNIAVRLRNGANLTADVELTIVPGESVTASTSVGTDGPGTTLYPAPGAYSHPTNNNGNNSYGSNDGYSGVNDINFYEITSTAVPDREIMVGGAMRKILIGDPTMASTIPANFTSIAGFEYIETDPDKNHMVSPAFVVASRRGATSQLSWANGRERCRRYRESQYPAGTWRMPTFAELAMLGDMQNDDNSAVKGLFIPSNQTTGTGWWTALNAYKIRADLYTYAAGTGVFSGGEAAVRCVRDTWKVYDQDDYGVYAD